MKLLDVLPPECVLAGADWPDKAHALRQIAELACKSSGLQNTDPQEVLRALQEREELGSTGFGNGIAIPHCRLESISDFVVGLASVPAGVEFGAIDDQLVKLIFFIIAPQAEPNAHIRLLSAISQTLLIPGTVDEMLAQPTAPALRESFLRHTRADIDASDQSAKSLFHILVQDEDNFHDILSALTGVETGSLAIIDAEHTAAYLSRMPLFAGFWTDKPTTFCRVILTVVEKELTNEIIRRIETITGDLNEKPGVMITVQELAYARGSLAH